MKTSLIFLAAALALAISSQALADGSRPRFEYKFKVAPFLEIVFPESERSMEVEVSTPEGIDQHGPDKPRLRFAVISNIAYDLRLVPRETFEQPGIGRVVMFRRVDGSSEYHGGKVFLDPNPVPLRLSLWDREEEDDHDDRDSWLTGSYTCTKPYVVPGSDEMAGVGYRGVTTWGIGGVFRPDWSEPGVWMVSAGEYRAIVMVEANPR